jgi:hypothetical protein
VPRRAERAAEPPPTSEFAEAIFDVVRALGRPERSEAEQQHALALAVPGLGLPHGDKRREIDSLLALPRPITHKHRLLVAAARAGEVVPAALLVTGVENLLEAAKVEPWRLGEDRGELMGWIELFPFSDNPEAVHDAIALLPEGHRQPHALRRLLEALPRSPALSALATLKRLAVDEPGFLQEFDWMNALINLDTEAAATTLLDYHCAGHLPVRDGFEVSRAFAKWANKYPAIRAAVIARHAGLSAGVTRRALERALIDIVDEEIFIALFEAHADAPDTDHGLMSGIRSLAIGRRPWEGWANSFEEFGLPLTNLRARLFAMLRADDDRARLAKQCLEQIPMDFTHSLRA